MYICFWCMCNCVYNYVSGVGVYNYVSGVGVYNYVSGVCVIVYITMFVLNLLDFKILCLSCNFAAPENFVGHFQDSQISVRTARFLN